VVAGVAHGVAEHLVDLLLRRHPPVGVGGTVHPDELWGREGGEKERGIKAPVFLRHDEWVNKLIHLWIYINLYPTYPM
jgi:hypothetical protein